MKKTNRLLLLALFTTLLSSGCASLSKGPNQQVTITSVPEGAIVLTNGQYLGTTPMTANLSRKQAHKLRIEKPDYYSEDVAIQTVPNEASEDNIRFAFDELLGAHKDLTPSNVRVELTPLILPNQPSDDPFGELAAKIVEVDDRLASGNITPAEHRYILSRLFRFYQP